MNATDNCRNQILILLAVIVEWEKHSSFIRLVPFVLNYHKTVLALELAA